MGSQGWETFLLVSQVPAPLTPCEAWSLALDVLSPFSPLGLTHPLLPYWAQGPVTIGLDPRLPLCMPASPGHQSAWRLPSSGHHLKGSPRRRAETTTPTPTVPRGRCPLCGCTQCPYRDPQLRNHAFPQQYLNEAVGLYSLHTVCADDGRGWMTCPSPQSL